MVIGEGYGSMMSGDLIGGMLLLGIGMMVFMFLLAVAAYVYYGFAYMAIAKKLKFRSPGIAWIPLVGPAIIAFQTAKMHWWPWLLIIGMFIPVISPLFAIAFGVFVIIWHWKMFEALKKPGWWAILMIVGIVREVLIGITAWGKK